MGGNIGVDRDGPQLRITIARPERLNALDLPTLRELTTAVRLAHGDPGVRVVILAGEGRAFCTGADLTAVDEPPAVLLDAANELIRAVVQTPVPVIAAVNGPAVGFGVGLACAADLVFAAESAYFYMSFTAIGAMPDGGTTALLAASAGRAIALDMALLAERLPAADAAAAHLLTRAVPDAELHARVDEVAERLSHGPRRALELTKKAVNAAALAELDGALERERTGQIELLPAKDFAEGVAAFRDGRVPRFGAD
ncbi:enoyl-CoA hydratase-related protein [Tomitella cavernea]|uniref:2-(1,2-epoxy-1,2-dihydrophenyl)acetyl-CoA isomerase PaaG n=1 Tax=Tomitella cavernea TaxID=1387982 RepID=A0ABP9CPN9_9ACTN|nr:enoyl-CoA hydratase-related protein [Tomitella cavernea]